MPLQPFAAGTLAPDGDRVWKEIAMLVLETNDKREASSFHRQLVSWWVDLWAKLRHKPAVEAQHEKKSKQGPRSLIL